MYMMGSKSASKLTLNSRVSRLIMLLKMFVKIKFSRKLIIRFFIDDFRYDWDDDHPCHTPFLNKMQTAFLLNHAMMTLPNHIYPIVYFIKNVSSRLLVCEHRPL